MTPSEENKDFWQIIHSLLENAKGTDEAKVNNLRLACDPEKRGQLPVFVSFEPKHEPRWKKMREFFDQEFVQGWHPASIFFQLRLIAKGERRRHLLHDCCQALPLDD